ncbi:MAG TPA: saccharopine dehydrogenase NADP-binding domain-containing protein [Ktedonobacterales bacterium]
MTAHRTMVVFGAYGHTARFVVAEMRERGWTPILAGRDATKLQTIAEAYAESEARVASIDDPASLDRALAGAEAVINCAGPFSETAPAVIDAALRAGIHYVDVTGETLVAISTFARYADSEPDASRVRDAGIMIVPSMGFYGALGDLLATVAVGDWPATDEVTIAVALDSWKPTRGTRLAGERRAGRRVVFADHQLAIHPGDAPAPMGTWAFPAPFGMQDVVGEFSTVDVVTIARHLPTARINAWINRAPLRDLSDPNAAGPEAVDASGRSAQTFLVEVVARRDDEERRAVARGRDIYAITAPIVVEAVERILDGHTKVSGIAAAGQVFDARDFLQALSSPYLSLELP